MHDSGDHAGALAEHRRALELRERGLAPGHPDIATSHCSIGSVLAATGELAGALVEHRRAKELRERVLPPGHPDIADSHERIGIVRR